MQVLSRPPNLPDYGEPNDDDDDDSSDSNDSSQHSSIARVVITTTVVFGILLIIVVLAIVCKFIGQNNTFGFALFDEVRTVIDCEIAFFQI